MVVSSAGQRSGHSVLTVTRSAGSAGHASTSADFSSDLDYDFLDDPSTQRLKRIPSGRATNIWSKQCPWSIYIHTSDSALSLLMFSIRHAANKVQTSSWQAVYLCVYIVVYILGGLTEKPTERHFSTNFYTCIVAMPYWDPILHFRNYWRTETYSQINL